MSGNQQQGLRADQMGALVLLASLWGASFLFMKVALDDLDPMAIVATRTVLGTIGIGSWLLFRRGRDGVRQMISGVRIGDVLVLGLIAAALPFFLIAWAETRLSSSLAGILNASLPLVTALIGLRVDPLRRLRGWRNAGLFVGFAGVALVAGTNVSGSPLALTAMLLAVVSYAAGAHFANRRFSHVEPMAVAVTQTTASALIALPVALLVARPDHIPSAATAGSMLGLGLGGTALAWCIYYWLISTAGPQHAVAVTYLAPIAAVFYGAVLLDEHVPGAALIGAAIIIAGQVMTAGPARRRAVARDRLPDAAA
jgi:drug/metabolite transporter (DMT)-like permease